jgi:hypothetical protein
MQLFQACDRGASAVSRRMRQAAEFSLRGQNFEAHFSFRARTTSAVQGVRDSLLFAFSSRSCLSSRRSSSWLGKFCRAGCFAPEGSLALFSEWTARRRLHERPRRWLRGRSGKAGGVRSAPPACWADGKSLRYVVLTTTRLRLGQW